MGEKKREHCVSVDYHVGAILSLNLIKIDSLNLWLFRDGFTAVIISSATLPPLLAAKRQLAWTSERPPYLFVRTFWNR